LSKKNPERFLKRGLEIVRKGWGQPSIFNADMVVEELLRQGKSIEDARAGGTSGCVETGAFGREAYILTGYFNTAKVLEITLANGFDKRTGRQVGIATGDPRGFRSYDELFDAFRRQLHHFIEIKVRGNNVIERLYAQYMPAPFLSLLVEDCIANGRDYNDGGPRYNTTYIMGTAPGSVTDSLSAIRFHVFDRGTASMDELLRALDADFAGCEKLRLQLWNKTPKYGNDDAYADVILRAVFDAFYDEINGRPNTRGGAYRVNYLSTTCHVYFGSVTGATPDGRHAWEPLSDGISPTQGADRHGPTAVIRSAAKLDHARTGGTLLNQKFSPRLVAGEEGLEHLAQLVRSYFKLDGHHIQFNVVTAQTLRDAQREPEKHRDLIVRVAGYSDYFCDLTPALQGEIIARTEQAGF
jgi:formate C-acetyltransferase